jgi:glycerophosphoryl diester phosphodiesterase
VWKINRRRRFVSCAALVAGLLQCGCDYLPLEAVDQSPFACEDETWDEARVNPNRFIAHAGGQIDGLRYTNSLEALELAYKNGLRLFEFDLVHTSDGRLVAAHDWDRWRDATGSEISVPSHQQFKENLLHEKYRTLDLSDLERWFARRTDSYLVTDKVMDFEALLDGFSFRDRLIVEVFSVDEYHRALDEGVNYPMLSLRAAIINDGKDKVITLFRTQPVKFVAVSSKIVGRNQGLLARLRRNHTCVYVFTSNESSFLKSTYDGLVYGAYADDWSIDSGTCTGQQCDTY